MLLGSTAYNGDKTINKRILHSPVAITEPNWHYWWRPCCSVSVYHLETRCHLFLPLCSEQQKNIITVHKLQLFLERNYESTIYRSVSKIRSRRQNVMNLIDYVAAVTAAAREAWNSLICCSSNADAIGLQTLSRLVRKDEERSGESRAEQSCIFSAF